MTGMKMKFCNDHEKIINLLSFVILFLCTLTSGYRFTSYLSLTVFVFYVFYVIYRKPDLVLKYLFLFFMFISETLGISVCNLIPGMYMPELAVNSSFNGSMPLIFFAFFILLVTVQLIDNKLGISKENTDKVLHNKFIDYISAVVFILFTILFLSVLKNPSFAMKIDRFEYAKLQEEKNRFVTLISQFWSELIVFPIISLVVNRRKAAVLPVLMYCLYAFWTGNKFGPFFSIAVTLCMVAYTRVHAMETRKIRLLLLPTAVVAAALVGLAVFAMSLTVQPGQSNYLLDRTAQQSQLWWKTYEKTDGEAHISEFSNEIDAAFHADTDFTANIGSDYGIYKIMYYTTPEGMVNDKLASGSRYTEVGYACAYYYFGYIGPIIFSVFWGIIVGLIVNGFIKAISRNDVVKAIALIYVLNNVRTIISMHTYNVLIEKFNLLSILYIIVTATINPKFKVYDYIQVDTLKDQSESCDEMVQ